MRKLQLFGEMRVEFSRTSTKASAEFDRIQGRGRMKKKRNREESTCPTKLNHHRVQRRQARRPSEPENLIIKKSPREQHTLRKASNLSSKNTTARKYKQIEPPCTRRHVTSRRGARKQDKIQKRSTRRAN